MCVYRQHTGPSACARCHLEHRAQARGSDAAAKRLHSRVHGHGGEFGVDVSAGSRRRVTGERLGRRHLVPPAELQRSAAVRLLDLGQVRLGSDHHARSLAVHEVLLPAEGGTDRWTLGEGDARPRGGQRCAEPSTLKTRAQ